MQNPPKRCDPNQPWVLDVLANRLPDKNWDAKSLSQLTASHTCSFEIDESACIIIKGAAGYGEIIALATAPHAARQGHASRLLLHAKQCGEYDFLTLEVHANNSAARACYEKAGFIKRSIRTHYYKDGGDAVIYSWEQET